MWFCAAPWPKHHKDMQRLQRIIFHCVDVCFVLVASFNKQIWASLLLNNWKENNIRPREISQDYQCSCLRTLQPDNGPVISEVWCVHLSKDPIKTSICIWKTTQTELTEWGSSPLYSCKWVSRLTNNSYDTTKLNGVWVFCPEAFFRGKISICVTFPWLLSSKWTLSFQPIILPFTPFSIGFQSIHITCRHVTYRCSQ